MNRLIPLCLAAFGASCTPLERPVEIPFEVRLNGLPAGCSVDSGPLQMTDLRFYVHDIALIGASGQAWPVRLEPDGVWQNESVALVDLEDGRGACINGSPESNVVIVGTYAGEQATGIRFSIGIPEDLNHADPLLAEAPLAYSEMHWHWASGYKFLRAGVESGDDGFFLHVGSNRCEGTIGAIKGCRGSNRPEVTLPDFMPGRHRIVVDLDELVAGIDLADGAASRCMSGPANAACAEPFRNLGLDFNSGRTVTPARIFKTGRLQ